MPLIYSAAQASWHIWLHLAAAVFGVGLGAVVVWRRKGSSSHRWLGRVWVALMYITAIGSFWIQARGRFSLIHVLSVAMIVNLTVAIFAIRSGNTKRHRRCMTAGYPALCIAGLFTLLPYRMLGQLIFG
jgi:uncharacterized membrane protein